MMKSIEEMPGPEDPAPGELAHFQKTIHEKYGDYVKFKLDPTTIAVSTTDIEALKSCSRIFAKPEKLYTFLEPIMRNLLFLPEPENKAVRQLMVEKFSPKLVKENFKLLNVQIDTQIEEWLRDSQKNDGVIAIDDKVKELSMRMTVALIFGCDFTDSDKLGNAIHIVLEESLKRQYGKNYDPNKLYLEANYLNETIQDLYNKNRSSSLNASSCSFLSDVLNTKQYPTDTLHDIIKEVLMAGYHTIAATVCWTLYSIAKNPGVAKKVYEEIKPINSFDYEDLTKPKYLINVVKETLRVYPAGPYTARRATDDFDAGGYRIPKDTIIFYPIWAVHMSPQYWLHPNEFNPDRFNAKFERSAYLPFGFGARNCPGTNIANIEVLFLLQKILKKLKVNLLHNIEPKIRENFVLVAEDGIQLKISPRSINSHHRGFITNFISYTTIMGLGIALSYKMENKAFFLLGLLLLLTLCYYKMNKNNSFFFNNHRASSEIPKISDHNQESTLKASVS